MPGVQNTGSRADHTGSIAITAPVGKRVSTNGAIKMAELSRSLRDRGRAKRRRFGLIEVSPKCTICSLCYSWTAYSAGGQLMTVAGQEKKRRGASFYFLFVWRRKSTEFTRRSLGDRLEPLVCGGRSLNVTWIYISAPLGETFPRRRNRNSALKCTAIIPYRDRTDVDVDSFLDSRLCALTERKDRLEEDKDIWHSGHLNNVSWIWAGHVKGCVVGLTDLAPS